MDCLRSFTLNINQNASFSTPEYIAWNTANNYHPWALQNGIGSTTPAVSNFNVQGFKNINIFGISMIGNVYPTLATASRQGLVQDWGIDLQLTGNPILVGGNFGVNNFGFYQGGNLISLSKYENEYKLLSPIQSVTQIQVINLNASGIQAESNAGIDLTFDVTLIFYYQFEGE
jgi:hypothetical protein